MAIEDIVTTLFGNNIYNSTPPTGSLMYDYFLPFIIIWVIFFGVLETLPLFKKKMNLLLSVAMTLMITATPYWFALAQFIGQWGTWGSIFVFFLVFVFGLIAWAFGRGKDFIYTVGDASNNPLGSMNDKRRLDKLDEEIAKLNQKRQYYGQGTPQFVALSNQINRREEEKRDIKSRLGMRP
ncbi:MAG TPA: hypothetical protein VJH34_04100 [archaeon]|nr:hypothetical protein [archaeon]